MNKHSLFDDISTMKYPLPSYLPFLYSTILFSSSASAYLTSTLALLLFKPILLPVVKLLLLFLIFDAAVPILGSRSVPDAF